MVAKYIAKILPVDDFVRGEDMSNSLNHTKPKTYGTSSDDNKKSLFLNSQRFILHRVEMSDTLIGLAIKYNVTMESIKLLNLLWNELGLYALREIRIPVFIQDHEGIAGIHLSQPNSLVHSSSSYSLEQCNTPSTHPKLDPPRPQNWITDRKVLNERKKRDKFEDDFFLL